MAVETAKDKIKLNQIVGQKQEIITVDGDVIVNDVKPDVLKVINTNGTICVYKKEIMEGKIKMPITDLLKKSEVLANYVTEDGKALSNQKISAVLRPLYSGDNPTIERIVDKKSVYFKVIE